MAQPSAQSDQNSRRRNDCEEKKHDLPLVPSDEHLDARAILELVSNLSVTKLSDGGSGAQGSVCIVCILGQSEAETTLRAC